MNAPKFIYSLTPFEQGKFIRLSEETDGVLRKVVLVKNGTYDLNIFCGGGTL